MRAVNALSQFSSLFKHIGTLLTGNILASVANFVSIALLANQLSARDFGVFVLLQSYIIVLGAVFNPQAWQGFIKFATTHSDNLHQIIKHTWRYDLALAGGGFLVAATGAPLYLRLVGISDEYLVVLQTMSLYIFFNQTSLCIGLLRLRDEFKVLALQNVIASMLFLGLVLIGMTMEKSTSYFSLCYAFSLIIGLCYINFKGLLSVRKLGNQQPIVDFDIKRRLRKFNLYAHATSISDIPIKQLDTVLVGVVLSVEMSGVYKVMKQIGTLTNKLTGPITQVLYPELNKCLAQKNSQRFNAIFIKMTCLLLVAALPFAAILGLTSEYWLEIIFSDYIAKYAFEMSLFLFIHAIATSFVAIHPAYLAIGYVRSLFYITVLCNVVFIAALYLLGKEFALIGVVAAVGVQYLFTLVCKAIPLYLEVKRWRVKI